MIPMLLRLKYHLKYLLHDAWFAFAAGDSFLYRLIHLRFYRPAPGTVEQFIDCMADHRTDFQIVQVGANDGMTHDPVYRFIKKYRWKALLLEPQAHVFRHYLSKVYRHYPNVTCVNAAVGHEDGEAELFGLSFSSERWASGLARFDRSSLQALLDDGRLRKRMDRYGIALPPEGTEAISSQKVKVLSVATLMKQYDIHSIDLLLIDTEGFDYEVIKMLDIQSNPPKAIVFEDMHLDAVTYEECKTLLEDNDYRTVRSGPNTLAWQAEIDHLVPPFFRKDREHQL